MILIRGYNIGKTIPSLRFCMNFFLLLDLFFLGFEPLDKLVESILSELDLVLLLIQVELDLFDIFKLLMYRFSEGHGFQKQLTS